MPLPHATCGCLNLLSFLPGSSRTAGSPELAPCVQDATMASLVWYSVLGRATFSPCFRHHGLRPGDTTDAFGVCGIWRAEVAGRTKRLAAAASEMLATRSLDANMWCPICWHEHYLSLLESAIPSHFRRPPKVSTWFGLAGPQCLGVARSRPASSTVGCTKEMVVILLGYVGETACRGCWAGPSALRLQLRRCLQQDPWMHWKR